MIFRDFCSIKLFLFLELVTLPLVGYTANEMNFLCDEGCSVGRDPLLVYLLFGGLIAGSAFGLFFGSPRTKAVLLVFIGIPSLLGILFHPALIVSFFALLLVGHRIVDAIESMFQPAVPLNGVSESQVLPIVTKSQQIISHSPAELTPSQRVTIRSKGGAVQLTEEQVNDREITNAVDETLKPHSVGQVAESVVTTIRTSIANNLLIREIPDSDTVILTIQKWENGPWLARRFRVRDAAFALLKFSNSEEKFSNVPAILNSIQANSLAVSDALHDLGIAPLAAVTHDVKNVALSELENCPVGLSPTPVNDEVKPSKTNRVDDWGQSLKNGKRFS